MDLGLGRVPGTDQRTMMALRRHLANEVDNFPRDVQELLSYFDDVKPGQPVQAVPGQGLHVPIWLLGSSLYSAQLAAAMGLPFSFAFHFAPDMLWEALSLYHEHFTPSRTHGAALCHGLYQCDRGRPGLLPPSVSDIEALWSPGEQYGVEQALRLSVVGDAAQVKSGLEALGKTPAPTNW